MKGLVLDPSRPHLPAGPLVQFGFCDVEILKVQGSGSRVEGLGFRLSLGL